MAFTILKRVPVLVLVTLFVASTLQAQSLWQETAPKEFPAESSFAYLDKAGNQVKHFDLSVPVLEQVLAQAPLENSGQSNQQSIQLPLPSGSIQTFSLTEYELFTDGVHSSERAFYGVGIDNPSQRIRADYTVHGFRVMIIGDKEEGVSYIEPMVLGDPGKGYISFAREGLETLNGFNCSFDPNGINPEKSGGGSAQRAGDCTFRSYRLAMATTGEYSNHFGATSASQSALVSAAVMTTINRVNSVFETEVAVRLILLGNTSNTFYYNSGSDPYTDGNASAMLSQNISNMNSVYGSGAFDIGHVFGADGGNGVAYLSSVCGGNKAGGVTLRDVPSGDPFDIDYVAHEMGHQFGGTHTQNNSCNRTGSSAYEPGSASSIMGYAGICAPNVQNNSDAYFHAISLSQIGTFVSTNATQNNSGGNGCATVVPSSNSQPTVNAGTSVVLPQGTPFSLTATGSDPNSNPLTFQWEHYDNGIASMPPSSSSTTGPNFRSLTATSSPTRFFPDYNDVASGITNQWEVLPTVGRSSTFRVVARDNQIGGCTAESDITVTWSSNGPFDVTTPSSNTTWVFGQGTTVTWAVNGTNAAPVSCALVDLELSFDGGQTFSTTLATGIANNGTYTFTVPTSYPATSQAKVRATCSDGRFYNISDNFSIAASAPTIVCQTFTSTDVPKTIGPNRNTISTSTVPVFVTGQATDINVINVQGDHTYVADLEIDIISPSNQSLRLMYDPCGSQNNFSLSFDSEASNANGSWPCPPTNGLTYQALDDLSPLYSGNANGTWTLRINDDGNQDGGNLTAWGLEVCFNSAVPLPVELTSFNATATATDAIEIAWSTANEIGADLFEVMRWEGSVHQDITAEFATLVEQVSAKGPAGANYAILDKDVFAGKTYYYQLIQKDLDGSTEKSEIVAVQLRGSLSAKPVIRDEINTWKISNISNEAVTIKLVDALGRIVQEHTNPSPTFSISKVDLTSGWYAIVIDGEAYPVVIR